MQKLIFFRQLLFVVCFFNLGETTLSAMSQIKCSEKQIYFKNDLYLGLTQGLIPVPYKEQALANIDYFSEIMLALKEYMTLSNEAKLVLIKYDLLGNNTVASLNISDKDQAMLSSSFTVLLNYGCIPFNCFNRLYLKNHHIKTCCEEIVLLLEQLSNAAGLSKKPTLLLMDGNNPALYLYTTIFFPNYTCYLYPTVAINLDTFFFFCTGLMTKDELAVLIAHEIGHIKNRHYKDAMKVLAFKNVYNETNYTSLLHNVACENEYSADRFAAKLTGNPRTLISIFKKLSNYNLIPEHDPVHPPLLKRIAQLEEIAIELEHNKTLIN